MSAPKDTFSPSGAEARAGVFLFSSFCEWQQPNHLPFLPLYYLVSEEQFVLALRAYGMQFVSLDEIVDVLPRAIQQSARFRCVDDPNLHESAEIPKRKGDINARRI